MRLAAALCLLIALVGCERPLVDPVTSPVEVLGLDLDEVRIEADLPLRLRVAGATALTVNGTEATADAVPGVFTLDARLALGLNRLGVRATDSTGVIASDTLVALYLPLTSDLAAVSALPSVRTEAAVATDGARVLVTGGVGPSGAALASMAVLTSAGPRFNGADVPLLTPRAGHTASALPGGGILLVGGAVVETPARPADFVATAEWIPPGASQSRAVALPEGTTLRAGHTARALRTNGVTTVTLYGGLVPSGAGVLASGTIDVFEWREATEELVRLSPAGGAGAFDPATGHVQIPILDLAGTTTRAADVVFASAFAVRFDFAAPGTNYPYSLDARTVTPLLVPRTDAAGAPFALPGLALIAGGRDAEGAVLSSAEVYAAAVDRTFRLPTGVRLIVARSGAGATLLPDGRILIAGGRTAAGAPSSAIDVFSL
ncbi:MAG TPA: kelch repeat-containing protein [Rubricoccaceae bacterium]|jgi:hypothetical protein